MSDLVWKNHSSYTVKWFIITPFGSQAEELKPGSEHIVPAHPDIKSIGILVEAAPVYVINAMHTTNKSELIASDVIPMNHE